LPDRFDFLGATQPAHRDLERVWAPVRPTRDRFALQDDLANGQGTGPFHHLGQAFSDVLELTCEDLDFVAASVYLDACSVKLVLKGGLTHPSQGLGDVLGTVR
jgi:hypothetical protein